MARANLSCSCCFRFYWLAYSQKASPNSQSNSLRRTGSLSTFAGARLGCLPDALHVEQIATLEYPDNQALALAYANVLLNACSNNGLLSTKAQYQDWWIENGATDEVSEEFQWWYKNLFEYVSEKGSTPLVTRTAYRDWLIQKGQSLRTWWFPADVTDSFLPVSKDTLFPDIMNQSLSQLSLAERAKGGLLTSEPELWLNEILELEFPKMCIRDSSYLFPVVVLALSTGMRASEVMNLEWRDVDLARGWITLRDTKNGERRGVPLAGKALDLLRQHAKVRRLDTPLLWPGKELSLIHI